MPALFVDDERLVDSERERAFDFEPGFFATFFSGDADLATSLSDDLDLDRDALEDLGALEDLDDFEGEGDSFWRALDFGLSSSRVFERPRATDDDRLSGDALVSRRAFFEGISSPEDDRFDFFLTIDDDGLRFGCDGGDTTAVLFPFFFVFEVVLAAAAAVAVALRGCLALPLEGLIVDFFFVDILAMMLYQ